MNLTVSARDRRALTFGLCVVAPILLFAWGMPAYRDWQESVELTAVELRSEARNARASLANFQATLDSLEQRRDRLSASPAMLVPGDSYASASAALASRVAAAAASAQVQLGAVQIQADTVAASVFALVTVRADASGDVGGIARMLADLEFGQPILKLQEWSLSGNEPMIDQQENLRFEFAAHALMRNPEPVAPQ